MTKQQALKIGLGAHVRYPKNGPHIYTIVGTDTSRDRGPKPPYFKLTAKDLTHRSPGWVTYLLCELPN